MFARQHDNGAYTPVRRPLTDEDIEEHLGGQWSIGTYVVEPRTRVEWDTCYDGLGGPDEGWDDLLNTVKYVCFDLDTHDEYLTQLLCELVTKFVSLSLSHEFITQHGYPMLLKEFSGNKGTHVWLFFDAPIEASKVRRWIARDFSPAWASATDDATLEIFPKQDTVPEGGFGNLVKAPLGIHAVSGKKSEILVQQGWANAIDRVQPLDVSLVPDAPFVSETASRRGGRSPQGSGPPSPFPCVDLILYEGAGQGQRNQAMFHLALYCYGHAVPEDLGLEMCQRANEQFDPPLKDSELDGIIRQAYSGRYISANCGQDWLRGLCPRETCRVGWQVAASQDTEAGTLSRAAEGALVEVVVLHRAEGEGRTRLTIGHEDASNTPTLIVEGA